MDKTITNDLVLFFLQLGAMLIVALLFGQFMRKLHLPPVLGELIGGVLLGPSLLGHLAPGIFSQLFPVNTALDHTRESLIRLGMLFFLFSAGLEINLARFRQQKWRILATSILGLTIPFALGFGMVWYFPGVWGHALSDHILILALFIGTALSISALPVITRILLDFNLLQHELGLIIMSAATINDLIGWSFFAVLLGSLHPDRQTISFVNILGGLIIFSVCTLLFIHSLGKFLLPWIRRTLIWPSGFIGVITVSILAA
ncbi:cation:proton antiporter, partial [candidate division KSB1 bacterium]|nr:cation:proton antiporter [candidate division KSB1 bacterium]